MIDIMQKSYEEIEPHPAKMHAKHVTNTLSCVYRNML